jgi:hypothetical protein
MKICSVAVKLLQVDRQTDGQTERLSETSRNISTVSHREDVNNTHLYFQIDADQLQSQMIYTQQNDHLLRLLQWH